MVIHATPHTIQSVKAIYGNAQIVRPGEDLEDATWAHLSGHNVIVYARSEFQASETAQSIRERAKRLASALE